MSDFSKLPNPWFKVAFRRPHVVAAIPVALAIRIPNVCTDRIFTLLIASTARADLFMSLPSTPELLGRHSGLGLRFGRLGVRSPP